MVSALVRELNYIGVGLDRVIPEAVFMESLTILTRTTRSKKLEVKGGFYSKEDMKNELGYSATLIGTSL